MNWIKSLFSSFRAKMAEYFTRRALDIATLDGKPGMSVTDFAILVEQVAKADGMPLSGWSKSGVVRDWLKSNNSPLASRIAAWTHIFPEATVDRILDRLIDLAFETAIARGYITRS